jgi:hypothetical protein
MNTRKIFHLSLYIFALVFNTLAGNVYFVATDGSDTNSGTINAPFATLNKAQSLVQAGDTVYFRGGTYQISESQIMEYSGIFARVFKMDKSGSSTKRICYFGYPNERPVFNLVNVKPADKRVYVFFVSASYLHFRNFEVEGTQVTILEHTQSECFHHEGGNYCIYENLSMHDGMAIGFYITKGSNNLVLNCDAYNNCDLVSEGGRGGNVDGFGGHVNSESYPGNVFRGCRAWYNSDDGFDLINCLSAFTIENCWSFWNGYAPDSRTGLGDGSGFKSGGYGMSNSPKNPNPVPRHIVRFCLAVENKNQGFYANHHLGGLDFYNNTGYQNPSNFNMLNRKDVTTNPAIDVDGYGHNIKNNVSYSPRTSGRHIISINTSTSVVQKNSWQIGGLTLANSDFLSMDKNQLTQPRQADGSLPDIDFMKPSAGSRLIDQGVDIGFPFKGSAPDLGYAEYISELSATKDVTFTENKTISSVEYFNIMGQKINKPTFGIIIRKTIYIDNSNKCEKLLLKKYE